MAEGNDCGSCAGQQSLDKDKSAIEVLQNQAIASTLKRVKYKLFVMSGKGGVGKSSIAVNLAVALSEKGYKTGLLDVDIHGPSVPHLLGIKGLLDWEQGKIIRPKQFSPNLSVVSIESLLQKPDQAVLWRGPLKTSAIRQFIADVDWGDLDYLVIDSPPGTGDEPMTVLKTIPEALSIVVTTPQRVSLNDVRKAINFLQHAKANILGIVENMSGFFCPYCNRDISLFKKGGGKKLAERYDLEFLGVVPLDPASVVAGDLGQPLVCFEQETASKTALWELAARVEESAAASLELVSSVHKS